MDFFTDCVRLNLFPSEDMRQLKLTLDAKSMGEQTIEANERKEVRKKKRRKKKKKKKSTNERCKLVGVQPIEPIE